MNKQLVDPNYNESMLIVDNREIFIKMDSPQNILGASILDLYEDDEFRARFRFAKRTIIEIYREIEPEIEPDGLGSRRIPLFHQFLITIRYFASGSWQITSGDLL